MRTSTKSTTRKKRTKKVTRVKAKRIIKIVKTIGFRTEKDSLGSLKVSKEALYGAQTQRAVNNFPISGITMPTNFLKSLGLIKLAAAVSNMSTGDLDHKYGKPIVKAAKEIAKGKYAEHFPIDVFQTGSGTSSNMNANEVIARLANKMSDMRSIHPNNHVNMSQSSNDVIPTAIHVSTAISAKQELIPALTILIKTLNLKARKYNKITKTGRTHLMDAMPVTLGQEIGGWSTQIKNNLERIKFALIEVEKLPIGGTAVGTGINASPKFAKGVVKELSKHTKIKFSLKDDYFEALSSQDSVVSLSGQLKTLATSFMKIANDLRWMNSGPLAGFGEITLPAIQPGSSIMPGKVNPVIPEAVCMVAAQVIGNDSTITIAGQSGNFQLNVMLPVIAHNILESINILANSAKVLAKCINGFKVNTKNISEKIGKNPILVTALNSVIGYDKGAEIAKIAYKQNRPVIDVAEEKTNIPRRELEKLLNPTNLT